MSSLPSSPSPIFAEDGARFIPHIVRLKDIPADLRASMSEVWDALIALNVHNLSLLPDQLTDRYLSQYLGRSQRFVQKGLKALQDSGIILRHTKYGRRNIEIKGRIARRKESDAKANAEPTQAKSKPKAKSGPAPGPPAKPATPEQLAAAAAANAEEPDNAAPLDPEAEAQARKWMERGRELNRQKEAAKARQAQGQQPPKRTPTTAEEQKAALDAWKAGIAARINAAEPDKDTQGEAGQPSGP